MSTTYATADEAYSAFDTGLRERIEQDDQLAQGLSQLSDDELADVKQQWYAKQSEGAQIDTGRTRPVWDIHAAPDSPSTEEPITRKLQSPAVEQSWQQIDAGQADFETIPAEHVAAVREIAQAHGAEQPPNFLQKRLRTIGASASRLGWSMFRGAHEIARKGLEAQVRTMPLGTITPGRIAGPEIEVPGEAITALAGELKQSASKAFKEDPAYRETLEGKLFEGGTQLIGQIGTGGIGLIPQMYDEALSDAEQSFGKPLNEMSEQERAQAEQMAVAYSVIGGALEYGPLKAITGRLRGPTKGVIAKLAQPGIRKEIVKGFLFEGGTEALQGQLLDELGKSILQDGRKTWSPEALRQRFTEFLIGGILGGAARGTLTTAGKATEAFNAADDAAQAVSETQADTSLGQQAGGKVLSTRRAMDGLTPDQASQGLQEQSPADPDFNAFAGIDPKPAPTTAVQGATPSAARPQPQGEQPAPTTPSSQSPDRPEVGGQSKVSPIPPEMQAASGYRLRKDLQAATQRMKAIEKALDKPNADTAALNREYSELFEQTDLMRNALAAKPKGKRITLPDTNAESERDFIAELNDATTDARIPYNDPNTVKGMSDSLKPYFKRTDDSLDRVTNFFANDATIAEIEKAVGQGHPEQMVEYIIAKAESALTARKESAARMAKIESEGKIYDAALHNRGRSFGQTVKNPVFAEDLKVGDQFHFKGEHYTFKGIDEDTGEVILQDGVRLVIPPDQPLYVDRGQVVSKPYEGQYEDPFSDNIDGETPQDYVDRAVLEHKAFDAKHLEEYALELPEGYQIKNGRAEPKTNKAQATKQERAILARQRKATEQTLEQGKEAAKVEAAKLESDVTLRDVTSEVLNDTKPAELSDEQAIEALKSGEYDDDLDLYHDQQGERAFEEPDQIVKTPSFAKHKATGKEVLSQKNAKKRIGEWKKVVASEGATGKNNGKVVLSLFDSSGVISKPWAEAGYDVYRLDLDEESLVAANVDIAEVTAEFYTEELLEQVGEVDVVLAQPPCTDFACSGARWFKDKDADGRTQKSIELVEQTLRTIEFLRPKMWAIENPIGRIKKLTDLPEARMVFDPFMYGDPYTKRTQLWGEFNADLPEAVVKPSQGSKAHKLRGDNPKQKKERSLTPEGFAYSFYMANRNYEADFARRVLATAEEPPVPTAPEPQPSNQQPTTSNSNDLIPNDDFKLTNEDAADSSKALDAERAKRQQEQDQGKLFDTGDVRGMEGEQGDIHHGGPAKQGDAPAGRVDLLPEWAKAPAETAQGAKLLKQFALDKAGRKVGPAHVAEYINKLIGVQVRKSTSQTSKKHPAHYRPDSHLVMTSNPAVGHYAFHEAGHGLKELIESKLPNFFKPFEGELMGIVKMDGSYASAQNTHEGVAEWLRRRVENPHQIESLGVTRAIESQLNQHFPQLAKGIRDGARAWNTHQNRSAAARFAAEQQIPRSMEHIRAAGIMGDAVSTVVSSGQVLRNYDRRIYKSILKHRKEKDLSAKAAHELARQTRKGTRRLEISYNYLMSMASEIQYAMRGKGASKGIRFYDEADRLRIQNKDTFADIMNRVGTHWEQFQLAGWARTQLERAEKGLRYTGQSNGVTKDDLAQIVGDAKRTIPNFNKRYKEVQQWFNDVLMVKYHGGLKSDDEMAKMLMAYEDYWPLPKRMQRQGVAGGPTRTADIQAGDYRATGSELPLKDLVEVAEDRVHGAYRAYYWNQLGTRIVDEFGKIKRNKKLPFATRTAAGRVITPLKLQKQKAATIHEDEVKQWVLDGLKAHIEETTGEPLPPDAMPKAEDIQLFDSFKDIWRGAPPKDYNVVSLLRGGERHYYMIEDVNLFKLFAGRGDMGDLVKFVNWAAGPETQNIKRNITQSLLFAVRNQMRGGVNQMILGRGPWSHLPGAADVAGLVNRFSKKYPQVGDMGLLLSRSAPTDTEVVNRVKHSPVWNFLVEGFWQSGHKDPAKRLLSTFLQPANWLNPIHKLADSVNLLTGGRHYARLSEELPREGAGVLAKREGLSDGEAKLRYWEVTGQFNEFPGSSDLGAVYRAQGFTNPMMQGVRQVAERLTDPDPAVSGAAWFKLLAQIPAMASLAAIIAYKTMSDDEKEVERERTIEDRLGYANVSGYRVPFAYGPEGSMSSYVYNATLDHLLDRKTQWSKGVPMLGTRIMDMQGLGSVAGMLGSAINEARTNWDSFRDRHIVSPWLESLPAQEQYSAHTPAFYKELGRWMNYSPAKLQHIVRNGLARQVDEALGLMERIQRGKPLNQNADIPVVGGIFIRQPSAFNSASGRELERLESKLTLVERRLDAMGFDYVRNDHEWNARGQYASPQAHALRAQYQQLRSLDIGMRALQKQQEMAKMMEEQGMYNDAYNLRVNMVKTAQSVLAGSPWFEEEALKALDMIDQAE